MPIWKSFWGALTNGKGISAKTIPIANAPSSSKRDPKKSIVKRIGLAYTKGSGNRAQFDGPEGFDLEEVERAYNTEAYVRQAVDKYVDLMFKAGWDIVGKNQNAVDYVRLRMAAMAEATKIPTKQLLIDIAEDLVLYHNVFIVKARMSGSYTFPSGINAQGLGGTEPVVGYFTLPVTTVTIARDKSGTVQTYRQEIAGADKPLDIKPDNMVHMYVDKPKGRAFGVPFLWQALDDIKLLRQVEELIARLIYKDIFPLYQYQVGLAQEGYESTDEEIEDVRAEISELVLDGGIVLPERHNISVIGSQGKALDAYNYLKYFEQRVFTGLGVSETMMGRGDCYDEETQTLTSNGWKYYSEIDEADLIATYNPETQKIEYHKPIDGHMSHIFDYQGAMYHFTGKHVDMMVSPNHDVWVMTNREKPNWHKVHAEDLYNNGPEEFCILESSFGISEYNQVDVIQIPDIEYKYDIDYPNRGKVSFEAVSFAKFIGYYLSEGYIKQTDERHYCVSIAQKKEDSYKRILGVIETLGLKYNTREQDDGTHEITIHSKALWHYLNENAGHSCYEKHIPREFMSYQPEVMQALLDALMDGDGTLDKRIGRTTSTYYTVCDALANDVHELATLLGYKAKFLNTKQNDKAYSNGYINRVIVSNDSVKYRYVKRSNIERVTYNGTMYCYNVPNHLFVTRRNGKVTIQGNTANRGTADNMTSEMHDRIKAYQSQMEMFIDDFIFNELLREGGFDPLLRPEDIVKFQFKEIDVDNKIKKENQAIQKFTNNAITHEELRMELGMDPVSDEGRLYFNMVTIATADAAAAAKASVDSQAQPENQSGKKLAAKREWIKESIQDKGSLRVASYANDMQRYWGLTQEDVMDLVKQYYLTRDRKFPDFQPKEIEGILNLTHDSMVRASEKYITTALVAGVQAAVNQTSRRVTVNYLACIKELTNRNKEYIDKLLNQDLTRLITNALKSSNESDALSKVVGAFSALNYRINFIAKSEVYRAYNYGFAKAAMSLGYTQANVFQGDTGCDICGKFVGQPVKLSIEMDEIPPFHPNCTCTLVLTNPQGKEGTR